MTDRVSGNGRRDDQAGESDQPKPKTGTDTKVAPGTKVTSGTKAASETKVSTGPAAPSGTKAPVRPKTPGGAKVGTSTTLTKADKRALAKERKARLAAARRRRRAIMGVLAGLAVVVVIAGGVALIDHFSHGNSSTSAQASASTSASAAEPSATPSVPFPPTPSGADPALATKPTVTAGTGALTTLTPKILIQGTGPAVVSGQTITVNYVGVTYKDGKEFDSSWSRSQAFSTVIGQGKVIPGWDQGLVGVKVGSRVQLDIPSNLAYGDNPTGGQPAGALRFVVDVLSAS